MLEERSVCPQNRREHRNRDLIWNSVAAQIWRKRMDYLANDVGNLALYIRNTKCPPKTSKAIEEKKNDDLNIYIALCNKGKINRDMTGWEKIHTISQSIQVVC